MKIPLFGGWGEGPLPAARQVLQAYKDKPWGTVIKGSAETLRGAFTQKLVMLLHQRRGGRLAHIELVTLMLWEPVV